MEQNSTNLSGQSQNTPLSSVKNPGTPITDVKKQIMQKYLKVLIIVFGVFIILETLLVGYALKYSSSSALQLAVYPIVVVIVFYSVLKQMAENLFFQQFAFANGFSFQKQGLPIGLNGSLFFIGHSPYGRDLVTGKIKDVPFDLFNYQYTVGSGKSSATYFYTVLRMEYGSPLPPIFLQAKGRPFGGYSFGGPSKEDKEKIQLEGNFNEFFNVWAKKGFETEVFQVFTPDVMEKIQTDWKDFSLEFIGQQIYIYSRHVITKDAELESMYNLCQYLVQKIEPVINKMKGDLSALEEYYDEDNK